MFKFKNPVFVPLAHLAAGFERWLDTKPPWYKVTFLYLLSLAAASLAVLQLVQ